MVPNGWERKPLEKVAEIKTGVAKGKKGLKDPIDVPYLRVANVQDGHIDLSEVKTIQIERHQLERYSLQVGDVLMTEGGDFDKLGRGDVWQGQIAPCLNQNHVFAVRPNKQVLLPYFLAALSGSSYGKTYFLSCAKRSTNLASINSTQLKEFPVLLPPLPEQRKIAKILSTWDKAISTTEKLIETSKQQKKALMQQLLTGKKRLVNPETGKAFEGEWEETTVGAVASLTAGGTPSTKHAEYWGGNIPWMNSGEINLKQIYSVEGRITALGLSKSSTKEIPQNSVLIALAGQGKTRGTVAINRIPLCTNQSIAAIMPDKEKLCADFLYFNLDSRYKELRSMSTGDGGRGGLNLSILKAVKLLTPKLNEQQKIASVLTAADKEIEVLETKLAHFKHEKKALMQQLLTGKRRVKVDEMEVA
ncbi:restriction endonuclease subunit S [Vibrio diazotrophicus]|uniref:restriction endonuclease subunit S n=1 Tax=Vibrio diazotrophicus TaxID=685 RepID=UPI0022AFA779|nr:restriction endonuclease subunit S [Vibrio diazotrophicus]MCZ4370600.1 restriction endonuclease subunit S [Vibrio diazotrophicus]